MSLPSMLDENLPVRSSSLPNIYFNTEYRLRDINSESTSTSPSPPPPPPPRRRSSDDISDDLADLQLEDLPGIDDIVDYPGMNQKANFSLDKTLLDAYDTDSFSSEFVLGSDLNVSSLDTSIAVDRSSTDGYDVISTDPDSGDTNVDSPDVNAATLLTPTTQSPLVYNPHVNQNSIGHAYSQVSHSPDLPDRSCQASLYKLSPQSKQLLHILRNTHHRINSLPYKDIFNASTSNMTKSPVKLDNNNTSKVS